MSSIKLRYNEKNEEQVKKAFDVLMVWYNGDRNQVMQAMLDNSIAQSNGDTWEIELKKKVEVHKEWKEGDWLVKNHTVKYNNKVYRIIQPHTAVAGSEPDVALSLFRPVPVVYPGERYPRWDSIGLLDSENNWDSGDRVTWNGEEWESNVDNNVWEPGVSSWTKISGGGSGVDCTGVDAWDPGQHWSTYTVGDRRTDDGKLYELHTQAWAQSYAPSSANGDLAWTYIGDCNS